MIRPAGLFKLEYSTLNLKLACIGLEIYADAGAFVLDGELLQGAEFEVENPQSLCYSQVCGIFNLEPLLNMPLRLESRQKSLNSVWL
jgi:hypothetical protein